MLFNSYVYILAFLPIVVIGYFMLCKTKSCSLPKLWLIGASLLFYGCYNLKYLGLLCAGVVINFLFSVGLIRLQEKQGLKRTLFVISLAANIGLLVFFKFGDTLPLGISFYTFAQISYLVDVYRAEITDLSPLDYTLFMVYFPKISQGPIAMYNDVASQFNRPENRKVNYDNLLNGIYAFSMGLGKKVLLADNLAAVVSAGFGGYATANSTEIALAMVCYSLQIYFDFSGYCDMAYGASLMLNVEIPINFNSPYKSTSIADFWQRWHATLNAFFTKYIYIPLGGSRKGMIRTILNIMIVFAISGFWHGTNLTFIVWGLLNGLFVVIYRIFRKQVDTVPKVIRIGCTFIIATLLWSIFRSASINDSLAMTGRLFTAGFGAVSPVYYEAFNKLAEIRFICRLGLEGLVATLPWLPLTIFVLACLISVFAMKNTKEKTDSLSPSWVKCFGFAIIMTLSILSLSRVTEFIYYYF